MGVAAVVNRHSQDLYIQLNEWQWCRRRRVIQARLNFTCASKINRTKDVCLFLFGGFGCGTCWGRFLVFCKFALNCLCTVDGCCNWVYGRLVDCIHV